MMKKKICLCTMLLILVMALGGCKAKAQKEIKSNIDFEDLTRTESVELSYADQFGVEKYGVYDLITIVDSGRFLLVPEGEDIPDNIPEDIVVLQQPLDKVYLVSTSAMDLVRAVDSISNIRLSGSKEDGWYVEEAAEAMKRGDMLYAGKYNTPDYELILNEGCDLAVENTMIYHNPEVKEKLEELGIPVLVERSSYEKHPLGRLEWVKLYGILFDREDEADQFYDQQLKKIEPIMHKENNGCSAAFFYVTSNGAVNVRKPGDYISQMIGLAGGSYILKDLDNADENELSTMNMQMEDFYAAAKDADVLIYNSTIDGELHSMDDLIQINGLFSDFKAVQNQNVYCTSNNFFQKTTGTSEFIEDLNKIFTKSDTEDYTYLKKLR